MPIVNRRVKKNQPCMKNLLLLLAALCFARTCPAQANQKHPSVNTTGEKDFDFDTMFDHIIAHGKLTYGVMGKSGKSAYFCPVNDMWAIACKDPADSKFDVVILKKDSLMYGYFREGPGFISGVSKDGPPKDSKKLFDEATKTLAAIAPGK